MKCVNCKIEYSEDKNFCSNCGNKLTNDFETILINEEDLNKKNYKEEKFDNEIDKDFYGNDFNQGKINIKIILFSFLFLLLLFIVIGYIFISKPKNTLKFSLYKYFNNIENNYLKDYHTLSGNFNIKTNIDVINNNYKYLDIFNDIILSGTFGFDNDKNIKNLEFGSSYLNEKLLNGNIYNEKNNLYISIDNVTDKYLKYNLHKDNIINKKINNKDKEYLINSLKESFISIINDNNITSEKVKLKDKNINKITLKINKDNYKNIIDIFFNNDLKDYFDYDFENYIKLLEDFKFNDYININFYIQNINYNLIKFEIEIDDNIILNLENNKIVINYNNNEILLKKEEKEKYIIELKNNDILINIECDLKIKYNKTILNKDVSKSIDINKLSIDEINDLIIELSNNKGLINFYNELNINYNYENGKLEKIDLNSVINKINNKENFILLISNEGCTYCKEYIPKLDDISKKYKVVTYYIDNLSMQEVNELNNIIDYKYTPTTVTIINGKEILENRIEGNLEKEVVENMMKKFIFISNNYLTKID